MRSNLFPIAKEGWTYIISAVFAFFIFALLDLEFLEFFAFVATLFFIFLFRNPEREYLVYQDNSVVSPVDGTVISIEELNNEKYTYKVEIDSSYLNVSLLRAPFSSSLGHIDIKHGSRLSSTSSLSKSINENAELVFTDNNSNSVKVIHRLKQSFMDINIDAVNSQNFLQGKRYGVMVYGTTTLYLPENFRLNVSVGSELFASETLIGYFTK